MELAGAKQKWEFTARLLELKYATLAGDTFVSAALIVFLPSFSLKFRDAVVKEWIA